MFNLLSLSSLLVTALVLILAVIGMLRAGQVVHAWLERWILPARHITLVHTRRRSHDQGAASDE